MTESAASPAQVARAHSPAASVETSRDSADVFDGNWDVADVAHLLPSNLPVRRVFRAWERKPQSPVAKDRFSRKIWRRIDRPLSRPAVVANPSDDTTLLANACLARLRTAPASVHSPRKIVKKRCLFTSFGQNARANHWDQRIGTPLRKRPVVSSSVTYGAPTGLGLRNALPDQAPGHQASPPASLPTFESVDQDAWIDIDSDEDAAEEPPADESQASPTSAEIEDHLPTLHDSHAVHETVSQNTPRLLEQSQSPTELFRARVAYVEASSSSEPATLLQFGSHPDLPAFSAAVASEQSPISTPQRSSSAPPEDVAPSEPRPLPRMSDDTAMLHAFLNRAAATKKPTLISKRESLSNRRDSDAVRHALASPAKNDVLGELDPNSPSPRKSQQPHDRIEPEAEEGSSPIPAALEEPRAVADMAAPSGEQRVMRRSIRSRGRLSHFMPMVEAPPSKASAASAPNKITIRSATDRVALKRTDAQEMALLTRTNTRKNKGGSVMPVLRLCKLAAEATSPDLVTSDGAGTALSKPTRGIRWDQTLVYYQDSSNEATSVDPDIAEAEPRESAVLGDVTIAPTPTKMRAARRPRIPSQAAGGESAALADIPVEQQQPERADPVAAEDTSKAQPPKRRRSRIATPAKALLAPPASLLQPAAVAIGPEPSEPVPGTATKKSVTRALPAARKLVLDGGGGGGGGGGPPTDGKENRTASTPKKTGIPSIKSALPRLDPSTGVGVGVGAGMGASDAERLGLASPAKKRAKSGVPKTTVLVPRATAHREDELPGLSSPAKKPVRPRNL
ncbi:hypothetical protein MBLNU459_g1056t1 [Dothideomycetes sp. NU459]